LKGLWEMSKNTTDAAETPQARARALTRELMNFWRRATPENTPEDQEKRVMLEELGGRNVTFAEATRERLRLLQRHRAAGLVEYRIFGEVLSRSDDVLSGLPGTELVDFDTAWRDIGVAANLTGWLDDVQDELAQQQAEDMEAQREFSRSLLNSTAGLGLFNESELEQLDAEMALQWEDDQLDEPWWEKPWCPLPLRDLMRKSTFGAIDRFSTFFLTASNRSSYGFEQGKALVTREVEAGAGPTSTAWLAALGLILRRSGYYVDEVSGDLSRLNFFPLLLLLLAVARQGNIEAAAVYIIARTLGNMNAEALARYEGFDSPTFADERTSSSEASNTFVPIVLEAAGQLEEYAPNLIGPLFTIFFFGLLQGIAVFGLTIGLPLWLGWQGVSALLGVVVPPPPIYDPLDFGDLKF